MQDPEMLIPISLFAMVFGIFYVRSRENMAMIERGINPRNNTIKTRPATAMRYGLILLGAGVGLISAYLLEVFVLPAHRHSEAIYFSLLGIGGGLGLVMAYMVEKKDDRNLPDGTVSSRPVEMSKTLTED